MGKWQLTAALALMIVLVATTSRAQSTRIPAAVASTFNNLIPGVEAKKIKPAPVPGWYQGQVGSRIFYVNTDASFLLDGQIFDLKSQENLTDNALNEVRRELLAGVDEASMVIFKAPKQRYQITVFTDIDCGYCRKLHQSMAAYHRQGITVRYLAFPRAGMGSHTADVMAAVWCAKDRAKALTQAKQGKELAQRDCKNPVAEHYQLGNAMGVNGTPAIVFDSGKLIPGFVEAAQLRKMLAQG